MYSVYFLVLLLFAATVSRAQVGIDTSNPQAAFHIDGGKDNPSSGAPSTLQQANDVVVTSTGNVGLGTTAPTAKLEVAGQIRITGGTPVVNHLLQSDANGVGSWTRFWQAVVYGMSATDTGAMTGGTSFVTGSGGSATLTSITVPVAGVYRIAGSFYTCYVSGSGNANFELRIGGVADGMLFDVFMNTTEQCTTSTTYRYVSLAAGAVITWPRQVGGTGSNVTNCNIEVTFIQ